LTLAIGNALNLSGSSSAYWSSISGGTSTSGAVPAASREEHVLARGRVS
jgi:hypothetical protein